MGNASIPVLYYRTKVLFAFLSHLSFPVPSTWYLFSWPSIHPTSVFQEKSQMRARWPLPAFVLLWQKGTWLSSSRCAVPLERWILLGSMMKTSFLPFFIHLYTLVSPFFGNHSLQFCIILVVFWSSGKEVLRSKEAYSFYLKFPRKELEKWQFPLLSWKWKSVRWLGFIFIFISLLRHPTLLAA